MEMKEKLVKFGKNKSYYIRKKFLMTSFVLLTSLVAIIMPAYMSANLSNASNTIYTQTNAEEIELTEGAKTGYELTFEIK